jgi:diacylglycerol kinase (ATP)
MTTKKDAKRTLVRSLNDAVTGFIHVIRVERNMRLHFLFGFFVLLLAILIGVSRIEWMILCCVISLVLAAEMFNTAIEDLIDHLQGSYHPAIRVIKDILAGAVLVLALNAMVVGFMIFSRRGIWPFEMFAFRVRYSHWNITLAAILTVVFLVIAIKAKTGKGTPFRGGAVSGHSAVAFSLWTILFLTTSNIFVVAVTCCLAVLVAQSRLRAKIHSLAEVLAGALMGILVTVLVFQLLR